MSEYITKRDAVSRMSDLLMLELKGERIPTWNEVYNAMQDIQPAPVREVVTCGECIHNTEPEFGFCECANHHVSPDSCCAKVFHAEKGSRQRATKSH